MRPVRNRVLPEITSVATTILAGLLATLAGFFAVGTTGEARAASDQIGTATGLPVPLYVSLRSDRVNLRQGPSKEHGTLWIYRKAGLPVEITAEFETWRRIRDADGSEGWVLHSLLSGKRTAIVTPWQKDGLIEVRDRPDAEAPIAARLEPRVIANVRKCDQHWCRVSSGDFDGYITQKVLWRVYPNEKPN
jgi:SH3-like domain-containing protein